MKSRWRRALKAIWRALLLAAIVLVVFLLWSLKLGQGALAFQVPSLQM